MGFNDECLVFVIVIVIVAKPDFLWHHLSRSANSCYFTFAHQSYTLALKHLVTIRRTCHDGDSVFLIKFA